MQSRDGGIWVTKSARLEQVANTNLSATTAVRVWTPPASGWNATNVWAPELHFLAGHWYIYYAAGRAGPPYIYQRAGVLESVTTDPLGAYVDKGVLYTGDSVLTGGGNVWAIDLTVGTINGQLYAIWSGWQANAATDKTPQQLYIARMSNPWTIATNRVMISQPDAPWEQGTVLNLEEGPEFLTHNGQTFVIYSTRESWLPAYQLGQLRLVSTTSDPMTPSSWIKSGPVFSGTVDVFGVGHSSYTVSPDGTEDWIVYHSKVAQTPGWERIIRTQKFGWRADNSPDFGTPVTTNQPVHTPSGECP
ncbi:MAG: hypothetical protein NVS4B3_09730 [Gemmatimonadaceae bacterium]